MESPFCGVATGRNSGLADRAEVRRALALFADAELSVELRELPSGRSRVLSALDLDGLVEAAEELSGGKGLYFCINPVTIPPGAHRAAKVADVAYRRWFLIDVDPVKTGGKDQNATDAEKQLTLCVAEAIRTGLTLDGWPKPVLVDSGNGWHLYYQLDGLPCTPETQDLLRNCLRAIKERFGRDGVSIDQAVHNASRIVKLPGSWARKGPHTPDRPHRPARLVEVPRDIEVVPTSLLHALAGMQEKQAAPETNGHAANPFAGQAVGDEDARRKAYARAALERECGKMACASHGDLNNQFYRSAAALGNLVGSGDLTEEDVVHALLNAGRAAGCDNPAKDEDTVRRALKEGAKTPRTVPPSATEAPAEAAKEDDDRRVATIDDLARAGAAISWLWELWLPRNVLVAIAAEGGTGKTRFCADLMRRIRHGLPWPDGSPMTLPPDSKALWVVSDNHHDEMVTLTRSFKIEDVVYINAWSDNPYDGTSLDDMEDLRALEARIRKVQPTFVIVDTVGNSTEKNLSKSEDARAYYMPLQVLARRHKTTVLALTHLNAGGKFLGRRILEKVRLAIKLERPDTSTEKRSLEVAKSNSKRPATLGVTMGDGGNEYDHDPPRPPEEGPSETSNASKAPSAVYSATSWLCERLKKGPAKVVEVRQEAAAEGITTGTLYRAKQALGVIEARRGCLWWSLPEAVPCPE
jgi:hypothetical protein